MNHYNNIVLNRFFIKGLLPYILIFLICGLNGCASQHQIQQKKIYHSEFSGLHHLLLLNCETVRSNVNAGVFSSSKKDSDMVALALGEAFGNVSHIRLSHIPFTESKSQELLISQTFQYDGILTGKTWWQINAEHESSKVNEFDLMLQLELHKKDENNTIKTQHFYIPVMSRKGIIIKNQLFFCEKDDEPLETVFQTKVVPNLSQTILKLTHNTREIPVKKPPHFFDLKSQILFESKSYYALIQHIIESRLSQKNNDVSFLLFNARFNDAVDQLNESKHSREMFTLKKYASKFHTDLYLLGLCFEKTGRIKKALSCYRFVMKYAPDQSQLCADGIGRSLKTMGIRDHIQWSNLKVQQEPAFQLTALVQETVLSDEPINKITPKETKDSKPVIEEKVVSEPVQSSKKMNKDDEMVNIQILIDQWLSSWRAMKADEYLSYYAESFEPENNLSYTQWKKKRVERLKRKSIFVSIVGEIDIFFESDTTAVAFFIQDFESKGFYYKDRTKKRLVLVKEKNLWKIQKEQVLEIIP